MGFLILDEDGNRIGWVETEEEANDLLAQVPDDIYTFYVGGLAVDVDTFMLTLNDAGEFDASFIDMLETKYGRIPAEINPFEEIRDVYLEHNTFFLKLRYDKLNSHLAGQMLNVLRRTVPAGTNFFVIVEKREISEELALHANESVDAFYVADVDEDMGADVGEFIIPESVA